MTKMSRDRVRNEKRDSTDMTLSGLIRYFNYYIKQ